jgi:hypothetical protein
MVCVGIGGNMKQFARLVCGRVDVAGMMRMMHGIIRPNVIRPQLDHKIQFVLCDSRCSPESIIEFRALHAIGLLRVNSDLKQLLPLDGVVGCISCTECLRRDR